MFPPEGYEVINLRHNLKGGAMMEFVLMIIVVIAIVIYPQRGTFIEKVKFKGSIKSFELEIRTKEKNCPPGQDDSSNHK